MREFVYTCYKSLDSYSMSIIKTYNGQIISVGLIWKYSYPRSSQFPSLKLAFCVLPKSACLFSHFRDQIKLPLTFITFIHRLTHLPRLTTINFWGHPHPCEWGGSQNELDPIWYFFQMIITISWMGEWVIILQIYIHKVMTKDAHMPIAIYCPPLTKY